MCVDPHQLKGQVRSNISALTVPPARRPREGLRPRLDRGLLSTLSKRRGCQAQGCLVAAEFLPAPTSWAHPKALAGLLPSTPTLVPPRSSHARHPNARRGLVRRGRQFRRCGGTGRHQPLHIVNSPWCIDVDQCDRHQAMNQDSNGGSSPLRGNWVQFSELGLQAERMIAVRDRLWHN